MSMDTYIDFPVHNMEEWQALKPRLRMRIDRYEPYWEELRVESWRRRTFPLIFGPNCSTLGFYWWARDLLGTEGCLTPCSTSQPWSMTSWSTTPIS
jgi:uroporphyrinogen decarboxylase